MAEQINLGGDGAELHAKYINLQNKINAPEMIFVHMKQKLKLLKMNY